MVRQTKTLVPSRPAAKLRVEDSQAAALTCKSTCLANGMGGAIIVFRLLCAVLYDYKESSCRRQIRWAFRIHAPGAPMPLRCPPACMQLLDMIMVATCPEHLLPHLRRRWCRVSSASCELGNPAASALLNWGSLYRTKFAGCGHCSLLKSLFSGKADKQERRCRFGIIAAVGLSQLQFVDQNRCAACEQACHFLTQC